MNKTKYLPIYATKDTFHSFYLQQKKNVTTFAST